MSDEKKTVTLKCVGCDNFVRGWTRISERQYVHASHPISCFGDIASEGEEE